MRHRYRIAVAAVLVAAVLGAGAALLGRIAAIPGPSLGARSVLGGVPAPRLAHLRTGIDLDGWFEGGPTDPTHLQSFITPADLAQLRQIGFDHVRLPVWPDLLLDEAHPEVLNAANLQYLDQAITNILAQDLAVVVDMHAWSETPARLARDDAFVDVYARFWGALAGHLARFDADRVFLEIMNEPGFGTVAPPCVNPVARWAAIQQRLAGAIRAAAPQHTIVATGYDYADVNSLVTLTPLGDTNVLYTFHFYEPTAFTFQGATWGDPNWILFHDLPYPSSPARCAAVLPGIDAAARPVAAQYCTESWDSARLASLIQVAADWATRNQVALYAGEFGALHLRAPPADRLAWLHDVHTLLEAAGIGWAMYNYVGDWGLMVGDGQGGRTPDWDTVAALGLTVLPHGAARPPAGPAAAGPPPVHPVPAPQTSPTPVGACTMAFTDVNADFWAYNYIYWLYSRNIVSGYTHAGGCVQPVANGPPCFHPNAGTSRAQIAKILVLAAGIPVIDPPRAHFDDVPPGAPFYAYVETAYAHDIVGGTGPGTFAPALPASRAQLAKMIVNAVGGPLPAPAVPTFADVGADSWAYPYVETAAARGFAGGYDCGTAPGEPCDSAHRPYFRPGLGITRAQLSKIVYGAWAIGPPRAGPPH